MLRSPPATSLRWRWPLLAVLGAVLLPAVPAVLSLWGSNVDFRAALARGDGLWLVVASLAAAPLFIWVIVPVMTPLVLLLGRFGWAGPLSLAGVALAVGLIGAHTLFNGDLTSEAPQVLPYLGLAILIQAACGWLLMLWPLRKAAKEPPATSVSPQK